MAPLNPTAMPPCAGSPSPRVHDTVLPGSPRMTSTDHIQRSDDSMPSVHNKRPSLYDGRAKFSQDDDTWSNVADIGSLQNSYQTHPSESLGAQDFDNSPLNTALVSTPEDAEHTAKRVHWTPSVTGASSTANSPASSNQIDSVEMSHPGGIEGMNPNSPDLRSFNVAQGPASGIREDHFDIYPALSIVPSASLQVPQAHVKDTLLGKPPIPPVELTNALIAKVQKHCRFAISSLDYEDADQARIELRAALELLGG